MSGFSISENNPHTNNRIARTSGRASLRLSNDSTIMEERSAGDRRSLFVRTASHWYFCFDSLDCFATTKDAPGEF